MIRLGGCPGWSESSMGAHVILLVLSCGGSFYVTSVIQFKSTYNAIQLLAQNFSGREYVTWRSIFCNITLNGSSNTHPEKYAPFCYRYLQTEITRDIVNPSNPHVLHAKTQISLLGVLWVSKDLWTALTRINMVAWVIVVHTCHFCRFCRVPFKCQVVIYTESTILKNKEYFVYVMLCFQILSELV